MISQIFKFGGGAGIGSYVIVMRDGTLENPNAEKIRLSYDNGDNLYLSILDDVTEEALLPLTGYVDNNNILHLSGRDFDDNKTYEFSISGEDHEIDSDIIDGITLGNGTIPTEGGGGSGLSVYEFDLYIDDPSQPFDILTPEQMEDIWENKYDIIKVNAHMNIEGGMLVRQFFERIQVVEGMAITYATGADPERKVTQISIMNNGGTLSYELVEIPLSGGSGSSVSGTNDGTNWTSLTIDGSTYGIPQGGSDTPYEANLIMGEHGVYMTQEDLDYIHAHQPGVVIVHQEQDGHDIAQTFAFSGYMTVDGSAYGRMTYQLLGENKSAFLVALPVNASDPVATMDFVYATTSQLSSKQDSLVSGTNIKTINNESILGAGNLTTATRKSVTPTSVSLSMDPFAVTIELSQADCADIFNNKYDFLTLLVESQMSINITCARQADNSGVVGYFCQIDTGTEAYYYSFALSSVAVYDNTTKRIDTPVNVSAFTNDAGFITDSYHDSSKQDALVSGTNIKTINNESILGSGNITIQGSEDSSNPWKGKVISIMGDSISTFQGWIPMADGHNLDHVTYYPKTGLTDVTKTWWHSLIHELDAKLGVNESWSGSYVGNTSDNELVTGGNNYGTKACMAGNTRIENLGANGTPDLIFVYGGTNDVWTANTRMGEIVPGTFDSTASYDVSSALLSTNKWTSFADAFRDMIRKMMYYYPKARIVVLFPFYSDLGSGAYNHAKLDAFIEVQRDICDYFGINYIDLRACGINAGNVAASKNRDGYTTILVGNVHPNIDGMALMKDYIKARLFSFFETDRQSTTVYTVTNSLSVNTNTDRYITGVTAGKSYHATITGSNLGLVKVYMGGTDVTSTVYNSTSGVINIASVTGNINIAEAELQSYTITTNVTNGSYTGAATIMTGGTATVTISPDANYALPVSVSVSGATSSYNSSTGVITLSNPTDNVIISATCVVLETYSITANVTNGSYSGDATIVQGRTASVTIAPDSSYMLPSSVTVSGATYSYDSSTGVISLSAPTGNVTITAVCTIIPVSHNIITNIINGTYSGDTEIFENGTAQVVLSADLNYALPSSITVLGASYTYDSTTGEIDLSNPTGNVTISAECAERGWFSSNYNANDAAHRTGEAKVEYAGFAYKEGVYDGNGVKMNAVRFVLKQAGNLTVGKVSSDYKTVTASETVAVTGSDGDAKEIQLSNTYTLENGEHFFISQRTDTCTFQYSNNSNAAPNGQKNFYLNVGYSNVDAGNRPNEVLSVDFGYFARPVTWHTSNYNALTPNTAINPGNAGYAYLSGVSDTTGLKMNKIRFTLDTAGTITVGKVSSDYQTVVDSEVVTVSGSEGQLKIVELTKTYTLENGEHFFFGAGTDTGKWKYARNAGTAGNMDMWYKVGESGAAIWSSSNANLAIDAGYQS